jgi:hypothetical protein
MIWPIWILNALLQWTLLLVLLWRRIWRQHPAFLLYIAFNSVKSSALMWIYLHLPHRYFAVNWSMRLIALPVLIAVLLEVFAAVFHPYSTLPKGTIFWLRVALGSLLGLTIAAAYFFPGPAPGDLTNTVLILNRSASLIFCGCFGFAALFSSYLGIPWNHRTYGIGVGFLLFLSVDLIASILGARYGVPMARSIGWISMLGYTLALFTWLSYTFTPDTASQTATLDELQRLQKALDYPAAKAESFGKKL